MDEKKKQVVESEFAINRRKAKELEDQTREELTRKRKEKEFIDLELTKELREEKYKKILALSQEKEQKERVGLLKSVKNKLLGISKKGIENIKNNSTKLVTGASLLTVLGTGLFIANSHKEKTIEDNINQLEQEQKADSDATTSKDIEINKEEGGVTINVNKNTGANSKKAAIIEEYGEVSNPKDKFEEVTKQNIEEAQVDVKGNGETIEEKTTNDVGGTINGKEATAQEIKQAKEEIKKVEEQKEQAVKEVKEQGGTIKEVDVLDKNGNSTGEKITAVTKTNDEQKTKDTKQDEKKGQPAINIQEQKVVEEIKSVESKQKTQKVTETPTPTQTPTATPTQTPTHTPTQKVEESKKEFKQVVEKVNEVQEDKYAGVEAADDLDLDDWFTR